MDFIGKFFNDFQKGYRDGQNGKFNPIGIIILILLALYLIQDWTGISVFDWLKSAVGWVLNKLSSI